MCVCFLVIGKDFSDWSPHITRTTIAAILGNDKEEHFIVYWIHSLKKKSIFYLLWKINNFGFRKECLRETIWIPKRLLFAQRKQTNLHSELVLSRNYLDSEKTSLNKLFGFRKDFSLQTNLRSEKIFGEKLFGL